MLPPARLSASPVRTAARAGYSDEMDFSAPVPARLTRRPPAEISSTAGGLVVDVHEGVARVAVIARRNRAGRVEWCLPKGHGENDETLEQTAVREVAEETGIIGRVLACLLYTSDAAD